MKNREIKFRAWDLQENKFFEPIYQAYIGKLEDLSISFSGEFMMRTFEKPAIHESVFRNRFILNQYTGLKDKNGIEIYEGDILKIKGFNTTWKTKVVFENGGFCIDVEEQEYNRTLIGYLDDEAIIEVIGNIYES